MREFRRTAIYLLSVMGSVIQLPIVKADDPLPVPFEHVIVDDDGPTSMWQKTVGDINGDGAPDLLAGGHSSGGLVWYESPSWTKFTIADGGGYSTDGEVVDVDGDGDIDVVSLTSSQILWYENPDWAVHVIEDRTLHDVEVADFDLDGDIDLVARNQGAFGGDGSTVYFYQQNSPTSWTPMSISIPNGEGLKAADIDADGDTDVVVGGRWLENTRDILGGPWAQYVYTESWTHEHVFVATGDLNGDGRLDAVLSPAEPSGETYRISWFEAPVDPKSGEWTEHIVENNVETVHHFVGVADFNNDGRLDIASAEMHQGSDPDEVKLYLNEGLGSSWTKQVIATGGSHSMRIVDFDNDGDFDLFGANWDGTNQVDLWINGTDPTTMPGDFNGDYIVDGDDYLSWQRGESPNPLSESDLADWEANYGTVAPLWADSSLVPEPTTYALALAALCLAMSKHRCS